MLLPLAIAIAPVFVLALMVYLRDRNPEPPQTLLRAFGGGIACVALVLLIHYVTSLMGLDLESNVMLRAYVSAGLIEEGCKLLVFMWLIWKHPEFDEPFDAIVYACYVSLGFACVENIMYVFESGAAFLQTGIMRALFAVPGHFFFAVIMGMFLAHARFTRNTWAISVNLVLALLVPTLLHGTYDYLLMLNEELLNTTGSGSIAITLGFYLFDFWLWRFAMKRMRRMQYDNY